MKKFIAWMMALLLVCGCAFAEAIVPEESILLPMDRKIEADLDGDGGNEKILMKMDGVAGEACLRIIIEGTDGFMNIFDTWIMYPEDCYAVDMDGDGIHEILLCGDMQSDDFITYCLNYDLENGVRAFNFADANRGMNTGEYFPEGYGKIVAVNGCDITLRGSQDVLGTWMADRTFTLRGGVLELDDGGMWIMEDVTGNEEYWEYFCLIPVREVPVTFEDGSEGSLAAGERFVISATDKKEIAYFTTREGKKGSIALTENTQEGWGYLIGGVPDYEYFEFMPYAD